MTRSVRDLAWLAGFFEGEASFTLSRGAIHLEASSTDRDVIERAVAILGNTRVYGPYGTGKSNKTGEPNKPQWRATVCGRRAAEWMMTLYVFMGERRRARIRECLSAWKQKLPWFGHRTSCLRGHPLSGENLNVNKKGQRSCRACETARLSAQYSQKRSRERATQLSESFGLGVSENGKAG
jgi:hypothetical protein